MSVLRWLMVLPVLIAAAVLLPPAVVSGPAAAQSSALEEIEVSTRAINRFRLASDETRFGALEFVGGFSMRARAPDFGQLSSFRFLTPGEDFIGVADHGFWFFGRIMRDEDQVPIGVSQFALQAMVDASGEVISDKEWADAEGLDIHDGIATVTFERRHRVSEYRLQPRGMAGPIGDLDLIIPRRELRYNAGIETILRAAPDGIHAGARIIVAERSIDTQGNLFAAILEGPLRGIFKVARHDGFDVTDGALLPDGDVLLLERRFRPARGVSMRLRRISADTIRPGALVDGPVLMEADLSHQIDNMEAVDVWRRDDGATMVSLMSDDNQSLIQRSLYLEFRMIEN